MPVTPLQKNHQLQLEPPARWRYKIIDKIAHGGFGVTYLADDELFQNKVVIKELAPAMYVHRDTASPNLLVTNCPGRFGCANTSCECADWQKLQNLFYREARHLLAVPPSPHVVRVVDIWVENNTAYFAIELVDNARVLRTWQRDPNKPLWDQVEPIGRGILAALELIHDKRIIHLDIKPANVLLTTGDRPVLIDFGAARTRPPSAHTKFVLLTEGWAPRASEFHNPAPTIDLYSWAMVLHALITADFKTPPKAEERALQGDPFVGVAGRLVATGTPKPWAEVMEACLSLDRMGRPQSVADIMRVVGGEMDWGKIKEARDRDEIERIRRKLAAEETARLRALDKVKHTADDLAKVRQDLSAEQALRGAAMAAAQRAGAEFAVARTDLETERAARAAAQRDVEAARDELEAIRTAALASDLARKGDLEEANRKVAALAAEFKRVQIGPRQAASAMLGSGEATRCWSRGRVPCVTAACRIAA
jgi:hypothetical protein